MSHKTWETPTRDELARKLSFCEGAILALQLRITELELALSKGLNGESITPEELRRCAEAEISREKGPNRDLIP